MVVTGRLGLRSDAGGGLGGEKNGGGGGDGQDSDGDGLNSWEDTVANVILCIKTNDPLLHDPGLELHQQIMGMLERHVGCLDRDKDQE